MHTRFIQLNESVASRRRVFFRLVDATDGITGKDITVTGVKVRFTKNGAASVSSTNDIVKVDGTNMPGEYYLEFTQAEMDTLGTYRGYLRPATCAAALIEAQVIDYSPDTNIADQILYRRQYGGANAQPTVAESIASGLMSFQISGLTLIVKHGDGTTAYTRTLTRAQADAVMSAL